MYLAGARVGSKQDIWLMGVGWDTGQTGTQTLEQLLGLGWRLESRAEHSPSRCPENRCPTRFCWSCQAAGQGRLTHLQAGPDAGDASSSP